MSHYDRNPKDLAQDTKQFLDSQFGRYFMETLGEMQQGSLSRASDINAMHPDRYLAKYNAVQEVVNFITSPLDDHISTHGQ